jgi:uncharacterized protein (TIGR00251 family)
MAWSEPGGLEPVAVWIQPRSSRDQVVGEREGAIAIRLQAPPVDGAANTALQRFVARRLAVAPSRVRLVRGQASRHKWLAVEGWTATDLRRALLDPGLVEPEASASSGDGPPKLAAIGQP